MTNDGAKRREERARGARGLVKSRTNSGIRERGQFLLDKEVSRTKQLMSLRLGGPARGFVLITSRRDRAWRGVRRRRTDSAALLLSRSSPPLFTASFSSRAPLFSRSLSVSFVLLAPARAPPRSPDASNVETRRNQQAPDGSKKNSRVRSILSLNEIFIASEQDLGKRGSEREAE